jgi:hypothetical protein
MKEETKAGLVKASKFIGAGLIGAVIAAAAIIGFKLLKGGSGESSGGE